MGGGGPKRSGEHSAAALRHFRSVPKPFRSPTYGRPAVPTSSAPWRPHDTDRAWAQAPPGQERVGFRPEDPPRATKLGSAAGPSQRRENYVSHNPKVCRLCLRNPNSCGARTRQGPRQTEVASRDCGGDVIPATEVQFTGRRKRPGLPPVLGLLVKERAAPPGLGVTVAHRRWRPGPAPAPRTPGVPCRGRAGRRPIPTAWQPPVLSTRPDK